MLFPCREGRRHHHRKGDGLVAGSCDAGAERHRIHACSAAAGRPIRCGTEFSLLLSATKKSRNVPMKENRYIADRRPRLRPRSGGRGRRGRAAATARRGCARRLPPRASKATDAKPKAKPHKATAGRRTRTRTRARTRTRSRPRRRSPPSRSRPMSSCSPPRSSATRRRRRTRRPARSMSPSPSAPAAASCRTRCRAPPIRRSSRSSIRSSPRSTR